MGHEGWDGNFPFGFSALHDGPMMQCDSMVDLSHVEIRDIDRVKQPADRREEENNA